MAPCRALGAAILVAGSGLRLIVASYPAPDGTASADAHRRLLAGSAEGEYSLLDSRKLQAGEDGYVEPHVSDVQGPACLLPSPDLNDDCLLPSFCSRTQ
jgi:hypothetical protein